MTKGRGDEVGEIVAAWRRERPDDDVSSILVVTPLWRLGAALQQVRADALTGFGLDQSGLDVLGALRRAGSPYRLTSGELSRRCRVTPGARRTGARCRCRCAAGQSSPLAGRWWTHSM